MAAVIAQQGFGRPGARRPSARAATRSGRGDLPARVPGELSTRYPVDGALARAAVPEHSAAPVCFPPAPGRAPRPGVARTTRHLRSVPLAAPTAPAVAPARQPSAFARPERSGAVIVLTRAGRLAITLSLVAVAVGVMVLALSATAGAGAGVAPAQHSITVPSGATLSGIAAEAFPDLPVAEGIYRIQVANRMGTDRLIAGQTLVIPTP